MKKVVRGKRSVIITFIFLVDWLPSSRFKITHFLSQLQRCIIRNRVFREKSDVYRLTIGFLSGCFEIFIFLSSLELNISPTLADAHDRRIKCFVPHQIHVPPHAHVYTANRQFHQFNRLSCYKL